MADRVDRTEVTQRAHRVFLERGRIDLSLRQIGAAIDVSARMLVYYFGNREQLIVAVLAYERKLQQAMLTELVARGGGPIDLLRAYFHAMTEPARRGRLRFFFDLVAEAQRHPERYETFLKHDLVEYWRELMSRFVREAGHGTLRWEQLAVVLAAARGLYLELLSTNDTLSVRRSYEYVLDHFAAALEAS